MRQYVCDGCHKPIEQDGFRTYTNGADIVTVQKISKTRKETDTDRHFCGTKCMVKVHWGGEKP